MGGDIRVPKALIVWGGWEGHQPEACSEVVKSILKTDGFDVVVENTTDIFKAPDLDRFDLIVPIVTQGDVEKDAVKALVAVIEAGVGLAGFHGGMGDAFRTEVDYQFMVGGQWVAHPGNIIDYRVNITQPQDPIMAGLSDFDYHSGQYYMHVDPSNEVLATTTFSGEHAACTKGVEMPVVWKRQFGKGRVFYSSLGHAASEFKVAEMKTILQRGMLWAARN